MFRGGTEKQLMNCLVLLELDWFKLAHGNEITIVRCSYCGSVKMLQRCC